MKSRQMGKRREHMAALYVVYGVVVNDFSRISGRVLDPVFPAEKALPPVCRINPLHRAAENSLTHASQSLF
jgi:hypothetical protein